MWVLVIFLITMGGKPVITQIDGFKSLKSCQLAQGQLNAIYEIYNPKSLCVKKG